MLAVTVPSEANESIQYVVAIDPQGEAVCTCPDFRFRRAEMGDICKHIARIERMHFLINRWHTMASMVP